MVSKSVAGDRQDSAASIRQQLPERALTGAGKVLLPRCVAVLPQFSGQRAETDAEGFGGFRAVTVVLGERGFNQPAFDCFERGAGSDKFRFAERAVCVDAIGASHGRSSSAAIGAPVLSTQARVMMFCSSRTLPGHS